MLLQIDLNITVWVILIKDLTLWIISFDFFDGLANSRKYRSFVKFHCILSMVLLISVNLAVFVNFVIKRN